VRAGQVSLAHLLCWPNGEKWLTCLAKRGLVMTDFSNNEMVALFKQHLKLLREGRDGVRAHIATSLEMIERSCALIVQIDEQINRMERELGYFGGLPRSGSPSLALV
jgi:hypothetical protein